MTDYRDWVFFISAGLAVLFMLWVFFKFTQQLAGPGKSRRSAEADSEVLRVVQASSLVDVASHKETRTLQRS